MKFVKSQLVFRAGNNVFNAGDCQLSIFFGLRGIDVMFRILFKVRIIGAAFAIIVLAPSCVEAGPVAPPQIRLEFNDGREVLLEGHLKNIELINSGVVVALEGGNLIIESRDELHSGLGDSLPPRQTNGPPVGEASAPDKTDTGSNEGGDFWLHFYASLVIGVLLSGPVCIAADRLCTIWDLRRRRNRRNRRIQRILNNQP